MLSIFPAGADLTAAGLGNGSKIRSFWHFSQPGNFATFGLKARHDLPASRGVAALAAQSTISCACSNERARACSHPTDPASYASPEGQRPAVAPAIELERRKHDPYAAFRFGDFSLFTAGNLLSITGRLMLAAAVEWELYARTDSATALGLRRPGYRGPGRCAVPARQPFSGSIQSKDDSRSSQRDNFGSAGPRFMETPCHSSTAETAPANRPLASIA
jgi:hypothetical protein